MAKHGYNIYKRKDGRWEGRLYSGKKYKSIYARTYSEAKQKLFELKAKNTSETSIAKCRFKFSSIAGLWLEDIKYKVKESSFYCYKSKLDKHILPYFDGIKYDSFTTELCTKFISDKLQSGLSAAYVSDMLTIIKMITKFAAARYHYENLVSDLKPPRIEKNEVQTLSEKNQKKLCNYLLHEGSSVSLGILLCLYTGLRVGELCAVQWQDIDFENKLIHVKKTCERVRLENGKSKTCIKITEPKTRSSVRQIPLHGFIFDILQRNQSAPEHFLLSGNYKCYEPRFMQHRFKNILQKSSVPPVRFHSLRHTFATNCLQAGFDVKTLSEIMGHSNVQTTLSRYVHSSMERKHYCINLLK